MSIQSHSTNTTSSVIIQLKQPCKIFRTRPSSHHLYSVHVQLPAQFEATWDWNSRLQDGVLLSRSKEQNHFVVFRLFVSRHLSSKKQVVFHRLLFFWKIHESLLRPLKMPFILPDIIVVLRRLRKSRWQLNCDQQSLVDIYKEWWKKRRKHFLKSGIIFMQE